MINAEEFANRRKQFMATMKPNSIALLAAAPQLTDQGGYEFPYRQDRDFYYLTGYPDPEAVALLMPQQPTYILFNQPSDPQQETWTGPRPAQTGACDIYQANEAFSIHALSEKLPQLLANTDTVYYAVGQNSTLDTLVNNALNTLRNTAARTGNHPPQNIHDITPLIHEMRLIKSPAELQAMACVAKISAQAHKQVMKTCQPNRKEYELAAQLHYHFGLAGCPQTAYGSIVAGGQNACTLHYIDNTDTLANNTLVLIDAGAEKENYAADITRTFPVNGRFTKSQKALYEIVLAAQTAVLAALRPGVNWEQLQEISVKVITEGLLRLDILQGDLQTCVDEKAYAPFYPHRIGHWLGLNVHDVGAYKTENQHRPFKAGMVLTVEPGIYINDTHKTIDAKWHNIGIRIEDDVYITETGYTSLTDDAPKTIAEIEAIMTHHDH